MAVLNLSLFENALFEFAQTILCNVKSRVRTNSISIQQRDNTERESLFLLYIGIKHILSGQVVECWVAVTHVQGYNPESQFLVPQLIVE